MRLLFCLKSIFTVATELHGSITNSQLHNDFD